MFIILVLLVNLYHYGKARKEIQKGDLEGNFFGFSVVVPRAEALVVAREREF